MILDDLLIHSDWLEENDIKNTVYKLYINKLRIELMRNTEYGSAGGFGDSFGNIIGEGFGAPYIDGNGDSDLGNEENFMPTKTWHSVNHAYLIYFNLGNGGSI